MHDEPETIAMTYAEVAMRLGVKLESVRRHARRKHWRRIKGNDGQTRVLLPIALLGRRDSPADTPKDRHQDAPKGSPTDPEDRPEGSPEDDPRTAARTIAVLAAQIERLAREVDVARIVADAAKVDAEALRLERDALRLAAQDVEALKATLKLVEAEKRRWHHEATRPLLSRLFKRRAA